MKRFDGIRFVALLKFGKALLVLATAYGAYRLLDPDTGALLTQWSEAVTDRFVRNLLLKALAWIASLNASAIHSAEATASKPAMRNTASYPNRAAMPPATSPKRMNGEVTKFVSATYVGRSSSEHNSATIESREMPLKPI